MKITRIGSIAAIAIVGAVALASCAANEGGTPDSTGSSLSGELIGAGASTQKAAQQNAWGPNFQTANPDVTVSYDPIGSGGGRDNFKAGATMFAGSDRAFKTDEIAEGGFGACASDEIMELPVYISPIAVIFNLDGVTELNMDAATVAGVFAGTITNWSDPAIASQNEGVDLPDLAISPVHRSDDSGTSANFTDYLSKAAGDVWTYGSVETWPIEGGEGAEGTSGVVAAVTAGVGTIGYADASQAGDLGKVSVKVGDNYVPYSAEAAAAVVDASPLETGRGDSDIVVALERDTTAEGVYPIVLVSYEIACVEYPDAATAELVKAYLTYIVSSEGQDAAAEVAGSAPISDSLREKALAAIDAIH